jgi:transcriptional regulator with XRE-family HTH domain
MTQAELAAAAGVNQQVVYRFENGLTIPRQATIDALRRALEQRGIEFTNGDRPGVTLDRSKAIIPT